MSKSPKSKSPKLKSPRLKSPKLKSPRPKSPVTVARFLRQKAECKRSEHFLQKLLNYWTVQVRPAETQQKSALSFIPFLT